MGFYVPYFWFGVDRVCNECIIATTSGIEEPLLALRPLGMPTYNITREQTLVASNTKYAHTTALEEVLLSGVHPSFPLAY